MRDTFIELDNANQGNGLVNPGYKRSLHIRIEDYQRGGSIVGNLNPQHEYRNLSKNNRDIERLRTKCEGDMGFNQCEILNQQTYIGHQGSLYDAILAKFEEILIESIAPKDKSNPLQVNLI